VVLPQHTAASPNAAPTIGSNPPVVSAANDPDEPLRFDADPQRAIVADPTGATGMRRFLRVKLVVTGGTGVNASGTAFTANPHPGVK
jgi:methylase of polypeptide subunit release factors